MPALAAMLACTVIGIADGDTLTARCDVPEGKVNVTVRVAEIDAPEKAQAWGNRSRQHLSALCFGKPAIVAPRTADRYGRTVWRGSSATVPTPAQSRCARAWLECSTATSATAGYTRFRTGACGVPWALSGSRCRGAVEWRRAALRRR
jgi:hypothetical protein